MLPPMRSIYRWKGAIEQADERQLLIKTTTATAFATLEARIQALHPYDVPEFLVIPITRRQRTTISPGSSENTQPLSVSCKPSQ